MYVRTAVRIEPSIARSRAPGPPLYRFILADGTLVQHIVCHYPKNSRIRSRFQSGVVTMAFYLLLDIRVRATNFSHTNGPHGNQTFD